SEARLPRIAGAAVAGARHHTQQEAAPEAARGTTEMAHSIINLDHIKQCERCGLRYDWRRSPSSSLKMTYCGSLCERAALGFTIDALMQLQRKEKPAAPVEAEAVEAAAEPASV